ncbi:hypothetical protein BLA39750_02209 [Burkholderia lata]|uniref:Uncharacterized protein n=1 Tax=Burkholderia lata (strain ATCC 17760 / DSM 23089 / LMG 22485 / NCIMB 9086 / R18194 / 383) TaxID=482957 RepID=A0A6P2WMZ1_BURL3|nr:hypothetical protein [Burkholderia lata]VWC95726.1 hypothetical protein BLA39750_02209 [Burkholderia lata]
MILGIDPGLYGALAFHGATPVLYDMPLKDGAVDGRRLHEIIHVFRSEIEFAAVENVTSRPRQKGVFNFGVSTGKVLGVLEALSIPIVPVSPQKWKQAMGLRGADKQSSVELAKTLVPAAASQLTLKRHDGRAEALLIALFASSLK